MTSSQEGERAAPDMGVQWLSAEQGAQWTPQQVLSSQRALTAAKSAG